MIITYLRKILWLVICLFIPLVSLAQVKVSGTIKDKSTSESLPGIAVKLLNPRDSSISSGAVSDIEGKFSIETNRNGPFIVKISSIG